MLMTRVQKFGGHLLDTCRDFGDFVVFCSLATGWFLHDIARPRRWALLWPQLYEVGTRSISVVSLVGVFIGMVLSVEMFQAFAKFEQQASLGGVIGISVVKNIGPVLAAVMLAGRVGGAFAAELGTMSVTEQVDAMRVMGTDPIGYLVVPRVLACIIMIPILTIYADLCGIFGGWVVTVHVHGVSNIDYWNASAKSVAWWDIGTGLGKTVFFGIALGLISCYKGFNCGRGAQGVGRATTDAFVTSFIVIIIINFFLAMFAKDLYVWFFGYFDSNVFG